MKYLVLVNVMQSIAFIEYVAKSGKIGMKSNEKIALSQLSCLLFFHYDLMCTLTTMWRMSNSRSNY